MLYVLQQNTVFGLLALSLPTSHLLLRTLILFPLSHRGKHFVQSLGPMQGHVEALKTCSTSSGKATFLQKMCIFSYSNSSQMGQSQKQT